MAKILEKIKDGIGLGIGLTLVFSLLIGVYAFVEPSSGPSVNNFMSSFTQAQSSITANNGKYDNRIPTGTFPLAYTEVCFKGGSTQYDVHSGANENTIGGNCLPGDIGFIIEKEERTSIAWEEAKQICLELDMRLPEPFEWKLSCKRVAYFDLNSMTGNWEWISNSNQVREGGTPYGLLAPVAGNSGCGTFDWSWIGHSNDGESLANYRCVK